MRVVQGMAAVHIMYIYIYVCPHVVDDYLARAGHGRDAIGVLVEAIASCGLLAFLYYYGHGRSQRQPADCACCCGEFASLSSLSIGAIGALRLTAC